MTGIIMVLGRNIKRMNFSDSSDEEVEGGLWEVETGGAEMETLEKEIVYQHYEARGDKLDLQRGLGSKERSREGPEGEQAVEGWLDSLVI